MSTTCFDWQELAVGSKGPGKAAGRKGRRAGKTASAETEQASAAPAAVHATRLSSRPEEATTGDVVLYATFQKTCKVMQQ